MALNTITSGIDTSRSTKLNNNFKYCIANQSVSTQDTSSYSAVVTTWTNLGYSKTFTPPTSDNMLLGILISASIKGSTSAEYILRGKITNNSNSQVGYFTNTVIDYYDVNNSRMSGTLAGLGQAYTGTSYEAVNWYAYPMNVVIRDDTNLGGVAGGSLGGAMSAFLNGSTYTLTFDGATSHHTPYPSQRAYLTNVTVTLFWTGTNTRTVEYWS